MRPRVPEVSLTPEERSSAVARLLATALLRLHDHHALAASAARAVDPEKTSEKRHELL